MIFEQCTTNTETQQDAAVSAAASCEVSAEVAVHFATMKGFNMEEVHAQVVATDGSLFPVEVRDNLTQHAKWEKGNATYDKDSGIVHLAMCEEDDESGRTSLQSFPDVDFLAQIELGYICLLQMLVDAETTTLKRKTKRKKWRNEGVPDAQTDTDKSQLDCTPSRSALHREASDAQKKQATAVNNRRAKLSKAVLEEGDVCMI